MMHAFHPGKSEGQMMAIAIPFFRSAATILIALNLWIPVAFADGVLSDKLAVVHPYARATIAGQVMGGAYMTIRNPGGADQLQSVSSPVAEQVKLHTMIMDGGVMQMREIESLTIPAGGVVKLEPNMGPHIMLIGLKAPLRPGQSFPLTLTFTHAGTLTVSVAVESANSNNQRP